MIYEDGQVVAVCNDTARVACNSRRDCARCAEGRGCGGMLLGRLLGPRHHELEVANAAPGLRPGDKVRLALDEAAILRAAALAYLVPLLGLLLGATLGHAAGGDVAAMSGAAAGLLAAWLGARRHARRHAHRLRPVARRS